MKLLKALIPLAAAAMLAPAARAQRTYELSVAYGLQPVQNYMATYRDHYDLKNAWGSVNLQLSRRLDFVPLIVGVGYSISSSPGLKNPGDGNSDVSAVWHTLTANVRYSYYTRGRFSVFAHAALGVQIGYMSPSWRDSYNITRFAWQASPIGVQYDFSRWFAGYIEAGMGTQGIIQIGVRAGI